MKISSCKNCHEKVSLFTKTCPACGSRVFHPVFGVLVFLVLVIVVFGKDIIGLVSNDMTASKNEVRTATQEDIQTNLIQPDAIPPKVIPQEGLILGPGTYVIGEDIPAGKYDCVAASGFGVLRGEIASAGEAGFVQTMGNISSSVGEDTISVDATSSYSNLVLQAGDVIYIEMSLSVEFIEK